MDREQIFKKLADLRPRFPELNIRRMAVFGSVARNEAGPASDVDIFVEFDKPIDLFEYMDIKESVEQYMAIPVDLITFASAARRAKMHKALSEAVDV